MTTILALVREADRILLGFEEPENLTDELIGEAKKQGTHYYLIGEAWEEEIRKEKIGSQVKFGYRWKFEE